MKTHLTGHSVKRRRVVFSYDDTQAQEVAVSGDFNTWHQSSHPMKRNKEGRWQKIVMLPPGDYEYKFVVDGHWQTDPQNLCQCSNCFGTANNIMRVPAK